MSVVACYFSDIEPFQYEPRNENSQINFKLSLTKEKKKIGLTERACAFGSWHASIRALMMC